MWPSLMNICVTKLRTKPDNTNCGCRKNEFGFQMRYERKKDDKEAATSRDVDVFLIWIISYRDTAHKTRPNEQVFRTGTCRAPRSTDRPTDQACIYSCICICSCSWLCQCVCTCFYSKPGTLHCLDGLSAAAATFWATQQVKLQQETQQQKSKINKQKECRRAASFSATERLRLFFVSDRYFFVQSCISSLAAAVAATALASSPTTRRVIIFYLYF